jgi:hypothetical protein
MNPYAMRGWLPLKLHFIETPTGGEVEGHRVTPKGSWYLMLATLWIKGRYSGD